MNTIRKNRTLRIITSALCALVICVSAFTGTAFAGGHLTPYGYQPPSVLIDLWRENNHVIGGIMIPGTELCYPILQHPTQDDYYLNICIDGTEGYPGSIYTNKMEGQSFDTFNTVIYGHNMRDGSYFGSLRNYLDWDYLMAHREIDIYAIDSMHVYDIFAVVVYDDRCVTDYFPDNTAANCQAFLDSLRDDCLEGSILLNDLPVSTEGHIITLSTCISDMHDNRLLIVAYERG